MPFFRTPSPALIRALGWDAVQELEAYFEAAAEELRAERRRLEATRSELTFPPGTEADVLRRVADLEYEVHAEFANTRREVRRELRDITGELRGLREAGELARRAK